MIPAVLDLDGIAPAEAPLRRGGATLRDLVLIVLFVPGRNGAITNIRSRLREKQLRHSVADVLSALTELHKDGLITTTLGFARSRTRYIPSPSGYEWWQRQRDEMRRLRRIENVPTAWARILEDCS